MGVFSFLSKQDDNNSKFEVDALSEVFTREVLMEIVNSTNIMMLFFSKDSGWIGANKEFFRVLGFSDITDFQKNYDSVRDLFFSESEEIFTEDDKSWLEYIKKHKKDGYSVKLYNANKDILDINLKCTALASFSEVYILEFEDVSRLQNSILKSQEIDNSKTKFLSNIGHEFRTPMNSIIGFLELLSKTEMDKMQTEYLDLINTSSKNLMLNIENLLDLSQMQGGRLTIDNASFELIPQMEELIYNHITAGKDRGIKVLSFIDPKLPLELYSDIRKIKQIMNSLIQNAIKFTQNYGKVIVEIKLLKREINGNCSIGFSVKDNGKGISKEDLENHAQERLGIGFSLSQGLVELLGSKLNIQSSEDEGSSFNFVLNFESPKGQTYKMLPKQKAKILLLDKTKIDEANFLSIYLRSFGIDVVKSNILDDKIYDGVETLYILADQSNLKWVLTLATIEKKIPIILLLNEREKLQAKLVQFIDDTLFLPLFPSSISKHLESIHSINLNEKDNEKLSIKDSVKALVVEDNKINQKLIEILLKEYNILVWTASNGNEAVSKCEDEPFDIIFMDIDMPEKNGIEATKEIKNNIESNSKTPIVALTAMAMQGDREMILKEGLDDYLPKPLTRVKLEDILKKYLKLELV
ncbi:MAG: response regulator [Sulfurimonas sp.]|nr:response regulator [Sulfurimonas sp.]